MIRQQNAFKQMLLHSYSKSKQKLLYLQRQSTVLKLPKQTAKATKKKTLASDSSSSDFTNIEQELEVNSDCDQKLYQGVFFL